MLLRWLAGWLRATFDYNPTFPISALLLLAGVRLLATDGTVSTGGTIDAGSPGLTALGLSIFQAYELLTLGAALLVLWPRRIAYETTSILRVFAVVRFAAPFLITGLALDYYDGPGAAATPRDGHPGAAVLMGLVMTGLMILKGEAITARIGLDLKPWERRWDYLLFGLAAVGLPLFAHRLSAWTGEALSADAARRLQMALWWGHAALMAPLALGLPDLGRAGPLRSRRPAAWWRVLSLIGYSALLANALNVAGTPGTPLLAWFPLALVAVAVVGTIGRAAAFPRLAPVEHLPALLGLVVLFASERALLGDLLSRPLAFLAWLPVAALALPLLAPGRVRAGLYSLGALAALAPVKLLPGWDPLAGYLLGLGLLALISGLVRKEELLVAGGGLTATVATLILCRHSSAPLAHVALDAAAILALLLALRLPRAPVSMRLAGGLYALGWGLLAARGVTPLLGLELVVAAGALIGLGLRAGVPALAWSAGLSLIGLTGWRSAGKIDPGVALVGLAFAAIPAGTWIALRREARRAEEQEGDEAAEDEAPAPPAFDPAQHLEWPAVADDPHPPQPVGVGAPLDPFQDDPFANDASPAA